MWNHRFIISGFLIFAISAAWATSVAEPGTQGFTVYTGVPVQDDVQTLHIQGKEVQVLEMITNLHLMNIPGGRQPIDFPADFLFAEDATSGHVSFCQSSFDQTVIDEKNAKSTDHSSAILQVNIDRTYSQITTDEGVSVYPDRAVSCWEVLDPRFSPQ